METFVAYFLLVGFTIAILYALWEALVQPVVLDMLRYRAFEVRDRLYRLEREGRILSPDEKVAHEIILKTANAVISSLSELDMVVLVLGHRAPDTIETRRLSRTLGRLNQRELYEATDHLMRTVVQVIRWNSPVYVLLLTTFLLCAKVIHGATWMVDLVVRKLAWLRVYRDAQDYLTEGEARAGSA